MATMIVPKGDRLLVERCEAQDKTPGGIVLPDQAKEKPVQGIVIFTGEGRQTESGEILPVRINAGDRVLFGRYSGSEVTVDGKTLLILKEDDVLAIVHLSET